MNLIDLLVRDHEKVLALFDSYASTDASARDERRSLVARIHDELSRIQVETLLRERTMANSSASRWLPTRHYLARCCLGILRMPQANR